MAVCDSCIFRVKNLPEVSSFSAVIIDFLNCKFRDDFLYLLQWPVFIWIANAVCDSSAERSKLHLPVISLKFSINTNNNVECKFL